MLAHVRCYIDVKISLRIYKSMVIPPSLITPVSMWNSPPEPILCNYNDYKTWKLGLSQIQAEMLAISPCGT